MISTKLHPWTPKLLWLVLPSIGGASLWWYIVAQTLQGHIGFSAASLPILASFLIFGVFSFSLWLGSANLIVYLVAWRSTRWLIALIVSLPILIFFPLKLITIVCAFGLWVVIGVGLDRTSGDAHNRLSIKPQLTLNSAIGIVVTAILIIVSLLYFQQIRGSSRTSEELSRRLADQAVSVAERFIGAGIKGYQPDLTVDQIIGLQIPTASDLLKDVDFKSINQQDLEKKINEALGSVEGFDPASLKLDKNNTKVELEKALDLKLNDARRQMSEQVRQNLADQFNLPIGGQDRAHDVLVSIVNHQFDKFVTKYVPIIPWLLALGLFFLLHIFNSIFTLATAWIGWLFYRLLRSLHIIVINHENVPAETLDWHA